MDLVQLKYFVVVAEAGHLTNAAKKLNIAQPALSVSIARLEKEVGAPLFDRVGRNIYLNHCGEIFLERAQQALDIMSRAQQEITAYCEQCENILTIGIVSKPCSWSLLMEFKKQYPNSKIRQVDITPDCVEEELQMENLDYVIAGKLDSSQGLVGEIIREEPMMLAVPAGHPLAAREWIRLADAAGENFIDLPRNYEYRTITDDMCRDAGFEAKVTKECFHCHMAELVASGEGVALMTQERAKQNAGNRGIVFLPLREPEYSRKHYIIWKAGHHFNRMARDFRVFLRENYGKNELSSCGGCQ